MLYKDNPTSDESIKPNDYYLSSEALNNRRKYKQ